MVASLSLFHLVRLAMLFVVVLVSSSGKVGVDGAGMVLERCASSAAAGDGRDLFSLQEGGELLNVAVAKCASVQHGKASDGAKLVIGSCDGAPKWEVMGNGQMKLKGSSDLCLSQLGLAPGVQDIAAKAAVSATSTYNSMTHGVSYFLQACCALISHCVLFRRGSDGC